MSTALTYICCPHCRRRMDWDAEELMFYCPNDCTPVAAQLVAQVFNAERLDGYGCVG